MSASMRMMKNMAARACDPWRRLLVPFVLLVFSSSRLLVPPCGAQSAAAGSVDLGYVASTGNTDVATFSLGQKLTWRAKSRLSVREQLRIIYGEADDRVNASQFAVSMGVDYTVFNGLGITIGAGYDQNRFSGMARRSEESLGLVWRVGLPANDSLRIDAGSVWTQQENITGQGRDFIAVRAAFWYKRPLPSGAHLQQTLEALPNMSTNEDWRINSETAVVAPLSRSLGLKLAYLIRYDHLPETTFERTDKIVTAGVQVTY